MGASATFTTRQFQSGNSLAVRLPADIAYPPETELVLARVGEKVIIEPKAEKPQEATMTGFVEWLKMAHRAGQWEREEVDMPERDWGR